MPPSAPFLSNPCGHRGCGKMTTESVAHTGPWVARSELRRGGNRLPAATPSPGARTRRRSQKPGSRGGAGSASPRVTPMPRARQPGGDQGALSGTRPGEFQAAPCPGATSALNLAPPAGPSSQNHQEREGKGGFGASLSKAGGRLQATAPRHGPSAASRALEPPSAPPYSQSQKEVPRQAVWAI